MNAAQGYRDMAGLRDTETVAGDQWLPLEGKELRWSPALAGERLMCAHAGCQGGWRRLLKRRMRPVLEGKWGCSKACVRALVEGVVRREMQDAGQMDETLGHRHRVPLGLVLLAQGLITQPQLRQALQAQRVAGRGKIGEWLVEACGVPEQRVTRGLGVQWQCPVLDAACLDEGKMALAMPAHLRQSHRMLPVRVAGRRLLYVAFEDEVDAAATFALERMSGLRVESGLLPPAQFTQAMHAMEAWRAVACRKEDVASKDDMAGSIAKVLEETLPVEARLVRVRDRYWLRLWLERGAFGGCGTLPGTGEDVLDVLYRMRHDASSGD